MYQPSATRAKSLMIDIAPTVTWCVPGYEILLASMREELVITLVGPCIVVPAANENY